VGVRVVLLGKLTDLAGAGELELAGPLDWAGFLAGLPEALAAAASDPRNKVAVNGALIADRTALQTSDGDEIALLPPVSGG
jgi:sulfur-carrier protein